MFTNPEISQNKVPELKVYHHLFENTGSKYIHNQHVKQQTCQLTRAERVGPASEFQTRLTRTVDENENPLETHIAINDMRNNHWGTLQHSPRPPAGLEGAYF